MGSLFSTEEEFDEFDEDDIEQTDTPFGKSNQEKSSDSKDKLNANQVIAQQSERSRDPNGTVLHYWNKLYIGIRSTSSL